LGVFLLSTHVHAVPWRRSKTHAAGPTHPIRYPAAGLFELASVLARITTNMVGDAKGSRRNLREAESVPTVLRRSLGQRIGHSLTIFPYGGDNMARN
jgi:hypothetical protein